MSESAELQLTLEDHEKAFTEVSFLLEILVRTAGAVLGKSTPSLGINAGRAMGRKLPIDLSEQTLEAVVAALARQMSAGYQIESRVSGAAAELTFSRCAVREVCKNRQIPLGSDLCKMFHYYVAGMAAQLLGKPVRSGALTAGDATCTARLDT